MVLLWELSIFLVPRNNVSLKAVTILVNLTNISYRVYTFGLRSYYNAWFAFTYGFQLRVFRIFFSPFYWTFGLDQWMMYSRMHRDGKTTSSNVRVLTAAIK